MVLGQEFEINEKSVTAIFEHDSVSKSDLYYKINKWIAKNYNSAQDVIQMSDEESGNIILKGISEIQYNNPLKYLYPKNGYIPTILNLKFNHTLDVGVKDN